MAVFWASQVFISLGLLGVLSNIYSGFILTGTQDLDPTSHLTVALLSTALMAIGAGLSIATSRRTLDRAVQVLMTRTSEVPVELKVIADMRQKGIFYSSLLLVIALGNILTGTFSRAGHFPLIHSLLGFGLAAVAISCLVHWIRFALKGLLR